MYIGMLGEIFEPNVKKLDLISWQANYLIKIKYAWGHEYSWFELHVNI